MSIAVGLSRQALSRSAFMLAICLCACNDAHPIAPTNRNPVAGAWLGAINDFSLGNGTARFDLAGDANSTRGSWSATIGAREFAGSLALLPQPGLGSTTLDFILGCSPAQRGVGTMRRDDTRLVVTYLVDDCGALTVGTMTLTRQ